MPVDEGLIQRVTALRGQVRQRSDARVRAEASLESVKGEARSFRDKLAAEGIQASELDKKLAEAEEVLVARLTAVETALNG